MKSLKLKEFVRAFQNNSLLHGVERSLLLQKVISAAIAYSAPCYNGTVGEKAMFYRNSVLTPAVKLITVINELFIINTDDVLKDVKLIWDGRYETLNQPEYSGKINAFHETLHEGIIDVSDKYAYWVRQLTPIATAYYVCATTKEF